MEKTSIPNTYPLSSLQENMLFHTLSKPNSGVDIEQIICRLNEPLEISFLKTARQRVIDRHIILRTSFQWEDNNEPVQNLNLDPTPNFETKEANNA